MSVILKAIKGPHTGRRIVLLAGQCASIGRTERADFAFPDDHCMSGLHFSVEFQQGECRLRDLQSSNGTLVNLRKMAEATLQDRDEIHAGQTMFVIEIEGAVRSGPRPAAPPVTEIVPSQSAATAAAGAASANAAVKPRPRAQPNPIYLRALDDPDPVARRKALMAAAWSGEKWVTDYCRGLADAPQAEHWDAIHLLASLATPDDLPMMLALGRAEQLGPRRFHALADFGHPGVIELLLEGIGSNDPATAVAAGQAFTKITGAEIDSDRRVQLPAEGDNGGQGSQQPRPAEAPLPSPERARRYWESHKQTFLAGTRFCGGIEVSRGADAETLALWDEESRREAYLRKEFQGR